MEMVLHKIEEILVESGRYSSERELIEDALRALIREKPELRVDVATELYKRGEVSLARASEIGGLNIEDFKELLKSRGIKIPVPAITADELDQETKKILEG